MFALADRLHMTVAELGEKLTLEEFAEWSAYLKMQANKG